jgi:uncharacterized protein (DUF2461 family)
MVPEHKGIYEKSLKSPMADLISTLSKTSRVRHRNGCVAKVSAFRIYRDYPVFQKTRRHTRLMWLPFFRVQVLANKRARFYCTLIPRKYCGWRTLYAVPEDLNVVRQNIAADLLHS